MHKIAFGGGCHWCTEAVFDSLQGVAKVTQGWVASTGQNHLFSEAVVVHYNASEISLYVLIEIHLRTHQSTSKHSFRHKYRSAIYFFDSMQKMEVRKIIDQLQPAFQEKIITQVLPFAVFKPSPAMFQNYYASNPEKPFCKKYIDPKLTLLADRYSKYVKPE